jgi:hypothetical protein
MSNILVIMTSYDKARNSGATHKQAMEIERLSHDGMLCRSGGLHAEGVGIPYNVWRRCCNV